MSNNTSNFPQPLQGTTVVDLSLLLPGPYCTSLLANFGARVIKVEPIGIGDPVRRMSPRIFEQYNCDKSSLVVDLKSSKGREILSRLVKKSDALIEGFRPGAMDRLGLSYDALSKNNKKLVYCSLSGFGQEGPYKTRPGHDLKFFSLAGYYSSPSQLNNIKSRPNVRMADFAAGQSAAFAMAMAMIQAKASDQGSHIDTSIFDAVATWSLPMILSVPDADTRETIDFPHVMADSDLFETSDGRFISIGMLEDKFWANFIKTLDDDELELKSEQFLTRRGRDKTKHELHNLLCNCFKKKTLSQWVEKLTPIETAWAPVYEGRELLDDQHLLSRELVDKAIGEHEGVTRFPASFSGERNQIKSGAPKLGNETESILLDLGYSAT
jgi:crotonobetainyl-CoA:carnitine CoA-transferase CaiB-like acyl-CoA transferase